MIREVDVNGDGRIDFDEFVCALGEPDDSQDQEDSDDSQSYAIWKWMSLQYHILIEQVQSSTKFFSLHVADTICKKIESVLKHFIVISHNIAKARLFALYDSVMCFK